jgi:hypothetical protein
MLNIPLASPSPAPESTAVAIDPLQQGQRFKAFYIVWPVPSLISHR